NTTVPVTRSQTFSTAVDNQPQVEIHVLQGEREMATDNKSLGRFVLDGIPPAPRGIPQIEVSFDIDASGILSVTAKDKASGKTQSIRIESSTGLSKDEIEKMKKDAELHAEEDKKKKELIEVKNMADTLSYSTEKAMKDAGDKLTDDERKPVLEKLEALKNLKDSQDVEAIKKATEELSQAAQKIGEKLYKAAQEAEAAKKGAEGQPNANSSTNSESSQTTKDAEVEPASASDGKKPKEGDTK
ncbi:MAG: Hsp70 family protein, partial [Candidatus Moraniibacteriota bacterium]